MTKGNEYEVFIIEVGNRKMDDGSLRKTAFGYAWSLPSNDLSKGNGKKNMIRWLYDFIEDEVILNKGVMEKEVFSHIRDKVEEESDAIERGDYIHSEDKVKYCAQIIAELSYHGWKIAGRTP